MIFGSRIIRLGGTTCDSIFYLHQLNFACLSANWVQPFHCAWGQPIRVSLDSRSKLVRLALRLTRKVAWAVAGEPFKLPRKMICDFLARRDCGSSSLRLYAFAHLTIAKLPNWSWSVLGGNNSIKSLFGKSGTSVSPDEISAHGDEDHGV